MICMAVPTACFTKVFEKFGIKFIYVDTTNADNISKAITASTKLIWLETPTNPLMNITDIAAVTNIAGKQKIIVCVDNTFASPYLQNPLIWALILLCILLPNIWAAIVM